MGSQPPSTAIADRSDSWGLRLSPSWVTRNCWAQGTCSVLSPS